MRKAFGGLAGYLEYGGKTVVEEICSKKGLDSGGDLFRQVIYWGRYDLWEGDTEAEPCQCEGRVGWAVGRVWRVWRVTWRGGVDSGGSGGGALGYWSSSSQRRL